MGLAITRAARVFQRRNISWLSVFFSVNIFSVHRCYARHICLSVLYFSGSSAILCQIENLMNITYVIIHVLHKLPSLQSPKSGLFSSYYLNNYTVFVVINIALNKWHPLALFACTLYSTVTFLKTNGCYRSNLHRKYKIIIIIIILL